eukprot:3035600-Pleurochrysis_carterae.AAC.2
MLQNCEALKANDQCLTSRGESIRTLSAMSGKTMATSPSPGTDCAKPMQRHQQACSVECCES